jgi:ribose-phosphate pyrophosphokinase
VCERELARCRTPVVLALPGFDRILGTGVDAVALEPARFPNGELVVRLPQPVAGRACVLVGSVSPPEERLATLLLAADTLKRHGAVHVQAVLPYLAYARQDRLEAQTSLACAWLGRTLAASGVDALLTVDPHSDAAIRLLGLPVRSLPAAAVLADALRDADGDAVIVAPDEGAIRRAGELAAALGAGHSRAWLRKRRTPAGVAHASLHGQVRASAIVVDDILDTGGTLISCCQELRRRGARTIDIAVTHGLFTGDRWRELLDLARTIHVTDTVPEASSHASASVHVHPIAAVLGTVVAGGVGASESGGSRAR